MHLKLILAVLPIALAIPSDGLDSRAANQFCPAVKSIVTKLKQQAAATAFCSSYLRIPTQTSISTSTSYTTSTSTSVTVSTTTIIAAANTITASSTSVETTVHTNVITSTVSSGTTTSTTTTALNSCYQPSFQNGKRAAAPAAAIKTPSVLTAYSGGKLLSSACGCLCIPTPTKTSTTVVTSVVPTTAILVSLTSTTTTPLDTTITIITSTVTVTTESISSTTVPAATAVVTATGSFKIVAVGSGLDGKYASIGHNINFNTDFLGGSVVHLDPDGTFRDGQNRQASSECCGTSFAMIMDGYQSGHLVCSVNQQPFESSCPLRCSMVGSSDVNNGDSNFVNGDAWNVAGSLYQYFANQQPISVYAQDNTLEPRQKISEPARDYEQAADQRSRAIKVHDTSCDQSPDIGSG